LPGEFGYINAVGGSSRTCVFDKLELNPEDSDFELRTLDLL